MMKLRRFLLMLTLLIAGVGFLTAGAQATSYTWNTTSSGNWSDAGNWTPGTGPPNANDAIAWVDGGNAAAVTVSVNGTYFVNQLKIDSNDAVSVNGNRTFYLAGTNPVLDMAGTFTLNNNGTNTGLQALNPSTLQGGGTLVLGGSSANNLVTSSGSSTAITLAAGHTIQGQGQISAPIVNHGTISAQGGTLIVTGAVTGDGTVAIAGSALDLRDSLQTGNFTMAQTGNLIVGNNLTVGLTKDFVFAQQDTSQWNWGTTTTLAMNGDGGGGGGYGQRLEIGGKDYGYDLTGFVSNTNFNLKKLKIGDASSSTHTLTFLSDWVNNGQRGGAGGDPEALYVDSLFVGAGDTLNLDGLHLYVIKFGLVPTGAWKNGGGMIIDQAVPTPLPSTLLLLGSGLLGLGLLGRRRKSLR